MQKSPSNNKLPRLPYEDIKNAILGVKYELSYAAVTNAEARRLNKKYRNKSYVPDVLSFPLTKTEGQIVMNITALKKSSKEHKAPFGAFAAYMFIHSCLHLKGHGHGSVMAAQEAKFLKKFGIKDIAPVR